MKDQIHRWLEAHREEGISFLQKLVQARSEAAEIIALTLIQWCGVADNGGGKP